MYAYGICAMLSTLLVVFSVSSPRRMHEKSAEMYSTFPLQLSESDFRVLGGFLLVILVSHLASKENFWKEFLQFSNKLQEASGNFALDFSTKLSSQRQKVQF